MSDDIQTDYETRVERLLSAFHDIDGLGSQLTIYHLLLKQHQEKGDYLWRIEPLLFIFLKSLEANLHVSLARLLEPKNRSHGNIEKFLSFCSANVKRISWNEGRLTSELIASQEEELAAHSRAIEAVRARRDKRFAHSDRKYFENADQIMEDFPLTEEDIVSLANCVVRIIRVHWSGLNPKKGRLGAHLFNETAVDNMIRNLETGRKTNFPGQLERT
ncbi:MAG: hypothetical protein V7666_07875 [Sulfitobacter sp.]|uniref:AbiU2 domain-containing protein n=1 Tax=Sulfitobacter sp. TaxID=1903071 RepID=UPI0030034AC0